jgi:hypothetical protein
MEFLCECADLECAATIHLSVGNYDRIRSSPTGFPIALVHDFQEVEDLVELSEGYAVVEKKGRAAEEVTRRPAFAAAALKVSANEATGRIAHRGQ